MTRAKTVVAALMLAVVTVGCGGHDDRLLVSAAASLADAFGDLAGAFERAHPDVDVELNLGATSTLREQILSGAPVDVFASANPANMQMVVHAGLAAPPVAFARNGLVIAVPAGNPAGITDLDSFGDPELVLGLCAPTAPCGEFARRSLARAGITPALDTEEPDVRALLTKIETGELDAGIVYTSDMTAASVDAIPIPAAFDVVAEYQIAVVGTEPPPAAAAFVDFVLSPAGREILVRHGFGLP